MQLRSGLQSGMLSLVSIPSVGLCLFKHALRAVMGLHWPSTSADLFQPTRLRVLCRIGSSFQYPPGETRVNLVSFHSSFFNLLKSGQRLPLLYQGTQVAPRKLVGIAAFLYHWYRKCNVRILLPLGTNIYRVHFVLIGNKNLRCTFRSSWKRKAMVHSTIQLGAKIYWALFVAVGNENLQCTFRSRWEEKFTVHFLFFFGMKIYRAPFIFAKIKNLLGRARHVFSKRGREDI